MSFSAGGRRGISDRSSDRSVRHVRLGVTVALAALTGTYILADPIDDGVRASSTVSYTEQAPAVQLLPSATVATGSYSGGYIDFAVSGATTSEDLGYTTSGSMSTENGVVSIVGTAVYLGNGSSADPIGSIDPIRNGQNGQPLRVNFVNEFANSGFETGDLTGWTYLDQKIELGVTNIAGYVVNDTKSYYATCGTYDTNDSRVTTNDPSWFTGTIVTTPAPSEGTKALRLFSSMSLSAFSGGYVLHGPAVYSSPFQAAANDVISFDWLAQGGGDDYSIFGYVLNTANGTQYEVLDKIQRRDGLVASWSTVAFTIPAQGQYRFVFVSGTHNDDCGQVAGASLYIDNVQVVGNRVDATVASNVAKLVTYANDSDNPAATRSVTFTAVNGAGSTTTTDTLTVNVTPVDDPPTLGTPATITYTNTSADDTFTNRTGTLSTLFSDPDGDTPTYDLPNGASETTTINSITYDRTHTGRFGTLRLNSTTGQYVVVPNDATLDPEQVSQSETFTVRATATGVNADATLTLAVTVPASAPTAPTGLTANPSGNGGVSLSWTAPSWLGGSNVSTYTVQTSPNGTNTWASATTSATTSATVTGLTAPSTWYFRVTATNATGTSAASATASSPTYGLPAAPTNVTATPGDQQVGLTWTVLASDGGASVTDYEYRLNSGSWVSAGTDGAETITGVVNGTAYSIDIRAVNAAGGGAAATVSTTPRTVPGTPTSLSASSITADGFDVSLSAPTDGGAAISRYEYRIDSGTGFSGWTTPSSGSATTLSFTALPDASSHDIEIRAVNIAGVGIAATITIATPARSLNVAAASTSILVDGTTTLSHTIDVGAGTVSYGAAGPCTVAGTTVTATGAGTCTITGTISTDSASVSGVTYSSVTDTETITISLETQAALAVTGAPGNLAYGQTVDLGTSGGSGSGEVTFAVGSSTACTVDAATGVATMTAGTGTCEITATKASTYRYSSVTSAVVSITPGPASVMVTGPSPVGVAYGDPVPVLAPVYSGLVGSDQGVAGVSCSTDYDPTDPAQRGVGAYATSCVITGSDPNYTPAFQNGSLVVGPAPLTVTGPSPSMTYGQAVPVLTPSVTGFVFDEDIDDVTTAPSCASTATATSDVGTYPVTCSGGTATNYSFTYTPGVVTISKAAQTALTITTRTADATVFDTASDAAVYGQRLTLSTGGGSGTGTVTHSVGSSNACTVTTTNGVTTVEVTAGLGTCTIVTTKAADTNHLVAATSTRIDVGPATLRRPGAPTVVAVNPTTVRVGIPQVTGASSHTVRLLAGTTTVATINVAAGTSDVTFSDLTPDTVYTATVTAISASDNWVTSDPSPTTDTTTPAPQAPPRSTNTTVSTATGPTVTQTPTLLTESDASRIARTPGVGGGTHQDEALDVAVRTLLVDPVVAAAVATPPSERSPEQINAIQTAARDLASDFDEERPAGVAPLFTVVETPTGVVIRGLLTTDATADPGTAVDQSAGDIPFENAIILESAESKMVLAAVDPTGQPIPLSPDGVLELYGATVAAAAYGFEPSASGEVVIFSTPRLIAQFATDDYGAFIGEFTIPADVDEGQHTLVFATPFFNKSLGVRVGPPERMLPDTGADTDSVLPWLILLTALGGFVWISSTGRDRSRRTLA